MKVSVIPRRRFNFESETAPTFADVERVDAIDAIDAEVTASGVTKQMEKDLRIEYGIDEEGSENESEDEENSDGDSDDLLEEVNAEDNIENLRKDVEVSMQLTDKDMSVLKFLQNCDETENSEYTEETVKNLDKQV